MSGINLKKNIAISGIAKIISMLLMFVISWANTRYLGPELKGKFSYLATIISFSWMVLDLGLYRSFPYLVRKYPDKIKTIFFWVTTKFLVETAVLCVIGIFFLQLTSKVVGFPFTMLYYLAFIASISLTEYSTQLQSVYMGMNRIVTYSKAQIIGSLILAIVLLFGYFFHPSVDRLLYVNISVVIPAVFSVVYFITANNWKGAFTKPDWSFIGFSYQSGLRVFLSSLAILLLLKSDIIIIKHMLRFSEVGIYAVASNIIDMVQFTSNFIGGLLFVKLSDLSDESQKLIIMRKLFLAIFLLLLVINIGFALIGKYFVVIFFGSQFASVYNIYLWLAPASFALSFGSLFNNYLNSRGFPMICVWIPAIALVLNFFLNITLIPVWGISGAAIATTIAYSLWFILLIGYEYHYNNKQLIHQLTPKREDFLEIASSLNKLIQKVAKRG